METIDTQTESRIHRMIRRVAGRCGALLFLLIILAFVGFVVRDRSVILALLFYLPLLPMGFAALALDAVFRGRSVKGPRFTLSAVGLAAVITSVLTMTGRGSGTPPPRRRDPMPKLALLHWNILWGGWIGTDASWASIEGTILRQRPDVVVLSEAPSAARLDSLERRLGMEWSSARLGHDPAKPFAYKLAVLSRWPVRREAMVPIRNGIAADIRVERPHRPLRLLVVDGESKVTKLRTPMLDDIAEACRRATTTSSPFDVVVGDFNALSRSLGFDVLRSAAGGYALASCASTGWRGTWPMPMPVYDIDHVWVHAETRVLSCSLFANLACDHRGQIVRLRFPGEATLRKYDPNSVLEK